MTDITRAQLEARLRQLELETEAPELERQTIWPKLIQWYWWQHTDEQASLSDLPLDDPVRELLQYQFRFFAIFAREVPGQLKSNWWVDKAKLAIGLRITELFDAGITPEELATDEGFYSVLEYVILLLSEPEFFQWYDDEKAAEQLAGDIKRARYRAKYGHDQAAQAWLAENDPEYTPEDYTEPPPAPVRVQQIQDNAGQPVAGGYTQAPVQSGVVRVRYVGPDSKDTIRLASGELAPVQKDKIYTVSEDTYEIIQLNVKNYWRKV